MKTPGLFVLLISTIFNVEGTKKESELRERTFGLKSTSPTLETNSLANLVNFIVKLHFGDCIPVVVYDTFFDENEQELLRQLFRGLPTAVVHSRVEVSTAGKPISLIHENKCYSYIVFLENLVHINETIYRQASGKVVVVSRASSWVVSEFLKNQVSRLYMNLLVITRSAGKSVREGSYLLYTHKLYNDGIGSSKPVLLTSWIKDSLTRPEAELFPVKLRNGFNGHRFLVSAAHQPPFVIRTAVSSSDEVAWDGIDIRVISLLGETLNFTADFRDPGSDSLRIRSPIAAVAKDVATGMASIGAGGIYLTVEFGSHHDTSFPHMHDCASFISLTSTALPRYGAVLGPFQPTVWILVTCAYLLVIIPITMNSENTLMSLLTHPDKMIHMFWFVFSSFTNSFTVTNPTSKDSLGKNSLSILIGLYWVFTIIITSCYTSSIIAFITVPVYPTAMETSGQLLNYRYRIGTLDHDGWETWFNDVEDDIGKKLLKNIEFVPTVEEGLRNASRAFFWPYAFLGSRTLLEYIVQAKFAPSWKSKRSLMHISRECFVPFGVTFVFPRRSLYTETFSTVIQRSYETGIIQKQINDVKWDVQRSSSGQLLQVSSGESLHIISAEERRLTLDDVQGMFMVLGSGILFGILVLILECTCKRVSQCCKQRSDEYRVNYVPEIDVIKFHDSPVFANKSLVKHRQIRSSI